MSKIYLVCLENGAICAAYKTKKSAQNLVEQLEDRYEKAFIKACEVYR